MPSNGRGKALHAAIAAIRARFGPPSLKTTLLALALSFIALSVLLTSLLTYVSAIATLRTKDAEVNARYAEAIWQNLHSSMGTIVNSSRYLLRDPKLLALYASMDGSYIPRKTIDELEKAIDETNVLFTQDVLEVSILAEKREFFRGDRLPFGYADLRASPVFGELEAHERDFLLLPESVMPSSGNLPPGSMYFAGLAREGKRSIIVVLKTNPGLNARRGVPPPIAFSDLNGQFMWSSGSADYKKFFKAAAGQADPRQERGKLELQGAGSGHSMYFITSRQTGRIFFCLVDNLPLIRYQRRILAYTVLSGSLILLAFAFLAIPLCIRIVRPLEKLGANLGKIEDFGASGILRAKRSRFEKVTDRISFANRLILLYGPLVIGASLACLFSNLFYTQKLLESQVENAIARTMDQTALDIESTLSNIERNSAYLAVYGALQNALSDGAWTPDLGQNINTILMNQGMFFEGLYSVDIYDRQGSRRYSTRPLDVFDSAAAGGRRESGDSVVGKKWLSPYRDAGGNYILPLARQVRSKDSMKIIGEMVFGYNEGSVGEKMLPSPSIRGSWSMLLDGAAMIISADNKTLIGRNSPDYLNFSVKPGYAESATVTVDGIPSRLFAVPIHDQPWTLVHLIPTRYMKADWGQILLPNVSLLLLMIFILITAIRIVSGKVVRPLEMLLAKAESVNLNTLVPSAPHGKPRNEIGVLTVAFDDMLERLNVLVKEVYIHELNEKELEKRKNEAQLRSLQYQINPHFLYNTFSSIIFLLKMGQQDDAIRMMTALSRLFHKSVHGGQITSISDEVEHVNAYIMIERMRYKDQLTATIDIPDALMRCRILKFILQPIAENAILHGIRACGHEGRIVISAIRSGDTIRFDIRDNGVGMGKETLDRVRHALDGGIEGKGIGLANVQERIRLHFGARYGLFIQSVEGEGTEVRVEVPAIMAEEEYGHE